MILNNYIHLSFCTITRSQNARRFCQICTVAFTSCSLIFACFLLISFSSTLEYFSFKATNKNWTKNITIITYEQICVVGVGLGIFWHWVMYHQKKRIKQEFLAVTRLLLLISNLLLPSTVYNIILSVTEYMYHHTGPTRAAGDSA